MNSRHSGALVAIFALFALTPLAALGQQQRDEDAQKEERPSEAPKVDAYEEFVQANKYVSYGGYTRAIPHYENVLKSEPIAYNIAHYNLGEIYRTKRNCTKANFHYLAYLATGSDQEALEISRQGLKECDTSTWPQLTVTTSNQEATIMIDGYIFSRDGKLGPIRLGPGSYEVSVEAPEHIPQSRNVTLKSDKQLNESFDLKKRTFYGTTRVSVDRPGATIRLIPKELDKPELSSGEITATSPAKEAIKLPTGKYLLEVTLDGYDRWIRHVYITRDQSSDVNVSLTRALPPELNR